MHLNFLSLQLRCIFGMNWGLITLWETFSSKIVGKQNPKIGGDFFADNVALEIVSLTFLSARCWRDRRGK